MRCKILEDSIYTARSQQTSISIRAYAARLSSPQYHLDHS